MINPAIFREYDIRGIADTDLTDDNVYTLGRACGTYYVSRGEKKVIVGQDVRISSPRIAKAMHRGLNDSGCDVIDIGIVPTPVLYFSLFHYNTGNGIMITASHNPKEFNGFKVAQNKSTIYGDEIQKLRRLTEEDTFATGKGTIATLDVVPAYLDYILDHMRIKKGIRVAIDTGNGTCGPLVDSLMKKIGADYQILYKEPDGNFPNHLADPTVVEHISELINVVKHGSFECGIGFDGDGDRIGVLDENAEVIWGDVLLAIYAEKVLQRIPGAKIIFEVKCSQGLIERIDALGGVPLMYKTGHSLIKAKMRAEHSPLAGEMSGHIFFADRYYGFDDAIYASLRLLEILSDGVTLSTLAYKVPKYYSTPEIRVETSDEKKFQIVEDLKSYFKKSYKVIDIDGVRVVFPDGWGLVRPSNTQPALVLRFEAKTEDRLEEIKTLFLNKLNTLEGN
ncbi:phosphomannomutase [candidate division WOR_3 bacterium SM23_60]|uniref:Phosphomannomutase n=1 Tax=candidate division WOR_3 bacterium SM23_60 TaxID=1703780 RepID=A0A0S8GL70_UNCW3|nr:MAG: phosphomannomutase [candidate division WOR_3 bacterium SM23_60]